MNTDVYLFWAIQGLLAWVFLYSLTKDIQLDRRRRRGGINVEVGRGEQSRAWFLSAHAAIAALLLHIIDVAEAAVGHKLLVSVIDVPLLLYLTFLSNHWQGQLIRAKNWWKGRVGPKQT